MQAPQKLSYSHQNPVDHIHSRWLRLPHQRKLPPLSADNQLDGDSMDWCSCHPCNSLQVVRAQCVYSLQQSWGHNRRTWVWRGKSTFSICKSSYYFTQNFTHHHLYCIHGARLRYLLTPLRLYTLHSIALEDITCALLIP